MYTDRINKKIIESSLKRSFITAIIGPRRVGKTEFVHHYTKLHSSYKWVILNMDDMKQRERIEKGELEDIIIEMAKQLIGRKEKIWVVIDEAQKCPAVFDLIKILYDKYKDLNKLKFILTGSAVLSLYKLSAETLAGRIELYHLQEFTLRESATFQERNIPMQSLFDLIGHSTRNQMEEAFNELLPFKSILEKELQNHLIWGGLPEILNMQEENNKITYLNNYIQTYLEKDIRAIETVTNLSLYRKLMGIAADQTGSVREDQRIINALGCTRDTLKKYRGYLEATLLYQDIYPYIRSSMSRLVKSPKGYLMNNGLVSALTGIFQTELLVNTGLIGHRLENWFLNELKVWMNRNPMRSEIYYWRLESGTEVDFVVESKPWVYPFEVTYSSEIDKKKMRNLIKFLAEEPNARWGFYIYRGKFAFDLENKICFIPAWAIG